jgi:lipopolysaccharide biosynthesis glycosyltransferase
VKVYFCINQAGLAKLGDRYLQHLAVTVHSCLQETDLEPFLIYDGEINDSIRMIEDLGCAIIQHELSFKKDLERVCKENRVRFDIAGGAFLRLDIPLLNQQDDYALYTDVDVMFLRQPDLSDCRPEIFAAAPETRIDNYAHINSGIMLINLPRFRKEHAGFVDMIIHGGLKTSSGDPYDQGHLNKYFKGRIDRLSPLYNWKPYWGVNEEAAIVHWHGVKYPAAKAISQGREKEITNYNPHPEIYHRNPAGYVTYMKRYEKFLETLPTGSFPTGT